MKIYLLHHHNYWTEYLEFLLEDPEQFSLIASHKAIDRQYKGRELPLFDPAKHKTILTGGRCWDETQNNLIITRFLHSPGYGFYPALEAYASLLKDHASSDFRFLMYEGHYRALMMTEHLPEAGDHFRYEMMRDKRVSTTKVDPMMYKFLEGKKSKQRRSDTGLVVLNWRIVDEDPNKISRILKTLNEHLSLSFVFHPIMTHHQEFMHKMRTMQGKEVQNCYFDLTRDEMVDLYDEHQYIITDGSGSCYEALLRGCKPLLIDSLTYQQNNGTLHAPLADGYLPFPKYDLVANYPGFVAEPFLREHYSFLYEMTFEDACRLVHTEVIQGL